MPEMDRAAKERDKYGVALVFSTKYDPPPLMGLQSQALEKQYFGLHHDLRPEQIALKLHGAVEWQRDEHGMWAAVISF